MKILLVEPGRSGPTVKTNNFMNEFTIKFFPQKRPSTFPILAAITPYNHTIHTFEGSPKEINYDESYDLVGITCTTPYAFSSYEIADEFRSRGVRVVLGGWHPSALPEEAKQHADCVVVGEAEDIWPELLLDAEHGVLKPFYVQEKPVDAINIPESRIDLYQKKTIIGLQATRGCPYGCEFCAVSGTK